MADVSVSEGPMHLWWEPWQVGYWGWSQADIDVLHPVYVLWVHCNVCEKTFRRRFTTSEFMDDLARHKGGTELMIAAVQSGCTHVKEIVREK